MYAKRPSGANFRALHSVDPHILRYGNLSGVSQDLSDE